MEFEPHELPVQEWRFYRLVKLTGWTQEQILASSARRNDWLLACEAAERRAEANAAKRSNSGVGHG